MRRLEAAGILALPFTFTVTVALLFAVGALPRAAGAAPARVRLDVAGVLPLEESGASILVLRERGSRTILPVMVPGPGRELRRKVEGREPSSVLAAIQALGGKVLEVEIASADEVAGGARIRVAQGARRVTLDGIPSESVALAVAAGAPIVTSRAVIDAAGLTPDDLARARERLAGGDRHGLRL